MKKLRFTILAFLLLSLVSGLCAQNTSQVSVYFETGQSDLSPDARQTLETFIPLLLNAPDYQVTIAAFADDRGAGDYNLQLAGERAAVVQHYLSGKGLIADKSSVQNWGEQKNEGRSDEERQRSRRVDLTLHTFQFDDFFALRERLAPKENQTFLLAPDAGEQTVRTPNGTLVIVPAHAFVNDDGTVPDGPVTLHIQEAFQPSDFILHNLTTSSDGRILQTGGMVCITAQANGRALRLAEEASLTVSIPNGGNFDPQMELFYAENTPAGGVNWKPAGQKFRKTLQRERVSLTIDPALEKRIAGIKVPLYPLPTRPAYSGPMPPEPQKPKAPYRPRAPKKPEWSEMERLFGGADQQLNRKELKKAKPHFEKRLENYRRDSLRYLTLNERYHNNMAGYEEALRQHEKAHAEWVNELRDRIHAIEIYQRELAVHLYGKALNQAIRQKAKTIKKYATYSDLYNEVEETATELRHFMMLQKGCFRDLPNAERSYLLNAEKSLVETIIGHKVTDYYKPYSKLYWGVLQSLEADTTYRIMNRMMAATGIRAISDSLKAEIQERLLLQNRPFAEQNAILGGYVATVSQLGWINCDRFYDDPAEKMQVVVNEAEEATLYAVCNDIRAMLSFQRDNSGRYVVNGLPKGRPVTVVAVKMENGMPQYARRDIKVGDEPLSMQYQSMPLRELKEALRQLNSI